MTFWTDALGAEVKYYDAAGVRTRVIEAGTGDAIIMMGGLSGHAEAFIKNVVPIAEAGFRVIAMDLIGHGFTDKPLDVTYHTPAFTRHLTDLLDATGLESAHLVGQSLGGWVAWAQALERPERVKRLVAVTGAGFLLSDEESLKESREVHDQVRSVTQRALEAPTREKVRQRLEWLMADPARVTEELVETRYRIYTLPDSRRAMPKVATEQPSDDNRATMLTEELLAQIQHESLILWTDKNPTTPARVGRRVAEIMPNARFEMVTDAGHWPQFEQPEIVNRLIVDFLRS